MNNEVVTVDHGNVFNTGHWYTFYCPHCSRQIMKHDSEEKCTYCNKEVEWKQA